MHSNCKNELLLLHISKVYVWLFDIDDKIERHMKNRALDRVLEYLARLDDVLATMKCAADFAEGKVFLELWKEMQPYLQERVGNDLIREIRDFFRVEKDIQANYRWNGKPIEFARYLSYRKIDAIILSCCLLVEYAQQVALDNKVYYSEDRHCMSSFLSF